MKLSRRAFWRAVGLSIRGRRIAKGMSLAELDRQSGLCATTIMSVENGEHEPSSRTLECLDEVLEFDEPLRSVLMSGERPQLWVPHALLDRRNRSGVVFLWSYYCLQEQLERNASRIQFCTNVLSTALSPPELLRTSVRQKFGRSRQARLLGDEVVRRSQMVCERIRRGEVAIEALCLEDATGDHFRQSAEHDRAAFIGRLFGSKNIRIRIASKLTEGERRAFSFAIITHGHGGRYVATADQPVVNQMGRDCRIESERGDVFRRSASLFAAYWNDRNTREASPSDLRGI